MNNTETIAQNDLVCVCVCVHRIKLRAVCMLSTCSVTGTPTPQIILLSISLPPVELEAVAFITSKVLIETIIGTFQTVEKDMPK